MTGRRNSSYIASRERGGMTVKEMKAARIKREAALKVQREEEQRRWEEESRRLWIQRMSDESARKAEAKRQEEAAKQAIYDMHEHRIATGWWKGASQ